MRKTVCLLFLGLALSQCQSAPGASVQVSNHYPLGECQEVGQVIGTANTQKGARDQALADLKAKASYLDANYVRIMAETAYSRAIRGMAYQCH